MREGKVREGRKGQVSGDPARGGHISMLLHRHSCKPLPQLFADVRLHLRQKVVSRRRFARRPADGARMESQDSFFRRG